MKKMTKEIFLSTSLSLEKHNVSSPNCVDYANSEMQGMTFLQLLYFALTYVG